MFNGKMKALTFSYDDNVVQDRRLIEMLNKYNLKATFNINTELFGYDHTFVREGKTVYHKRIQANEVKELYKGHEVASHALKHEILTDLTDDEIVRVVEEDRKNIEKLVGYDVVGFAYPCGSYDDRVVSVLKNRTGIKYARTGTSTYKFNLCDNPLSYTGTVCHIMEGNRLFELAERFLKSNPSSPELFYVWGHSYEFDINNTWDLFEDFCKMISNRDEIFYATNREVLL